MISWILRNSGVLGLCTLISILSALGNSLSLAIIQQVFGNEISQTVQVKTFSFLADYGASFLLFLAILIWILNNYFLESHVRFLASKRFDSHQINSSSVPPKVDSKIAQCVINDVQLFESFLNYYNLLVQVMAYAILLILLSPVMIRIEVLMSCLFVFIISKNRFFVGREVGEAKRENHSIKNQERNWERELDVFSRQNRLSVRLRSIDYLVIGVLITSPFLISYSLNLNTINEMNLFNFTLLLVFFKGLVQLAIQAGNLGFRVSMNFYTRV